MGAQVLGSVLGALYGRVASARRQWYEQRPHVRRHLQRPVISIGNLVAGGSGKTPVVATLARVLQTAGERPAILSRGYARRHKEEGVVVVSDGERVLEPVERSGDEPQMLARSLSGVPVLVSPDRYLAGRLAERRFGSTVMLLDDGFQHLQLARNVDLLLVTAGDLHERPFPSGRLREPLAAASAADALVVFGSAEDAARVSTALGVETVFTATADYRALERVSSLGEEPSMQESLRAFAPPRVVKEEAALNASACRGVLAVAGIARPERFFAALAAQGWDVRRELAFPDHHWFTSRDLEQVARAAREVNAALIVTTEKDAARLGVTDSTWAYLPMHVTIEPADAFSSWLRSRL